MLIIDDKKWYLKGSIFWLTFSHGPTLRCIDRRVNSQRQKCPETEETTAGIPWKYHSPHFFAGVPYVFFFWPLPLKKLNCHPIEFTFFLDWCFYGFSLTRFWQWKDWINLASILCKIMYCIWIMTPWLPEPFALYFCLFCLKILFLDLQRKKWRRIPYPRFLSSFFLHFTLVIKPTRAVQIHLRFYPSFKRF